MYHAFTNSSNKIILDFRPDDTNCCPAHSWLAAAGQPPAGVPWWEVLDTIRGKLMLEAS